MRNLALLPIEKSVQDEIRTSRDKLLAYAGIKVDILALENDILRVRVAQTSLINNYLLSQSQLVSRAGSLLAPLNGRYRIHYVTLSYKPNFGEIDHQWIAERKKAYKLSRNDLSKQLGIADEAIRGLLTGVTPLTQQQQAAFFYYFMTYELNRDFRELEILESSL
ncbi:hypothetical protein H9Q13_04965 [Pontibacter sp. JH31]|uniref:Uncharacterized protein n=1 Tax=Pontibacter aquaedesilientis TaxID=2766980 RepID=A0ABR7XE12_9BACT|nr:hypothetical protein [Pontibacter aquaedesilientis]MBD1396507.1 hypothetical protein [Pontibacter aquaedesilientis]